jgi:hypothetical protein
MPLSAVLGAFTGAAVALTEIVAAASSATAAETANLIVFSFLTCWVHASA